MALFVLCLVVIDIVILGAYTVTEAVRGNLGVRETFNREGGIVTVGVRLSNVLKLLYLLILAGITVLPCVCDMSWGNYFYDYAEILVSEPVTITQKIISSCLSIIITCTQWTGDKSFTWETRTIDFYSLFRFSIRWYYYKQFAYTGKLGRGLYFFYNTQ